MAKPYVRLTQPLVRDGGRSAFVPRPGTRRSIARSQASGAPSRSPRPDGPSASSAAPRRPTRSTSRPRSSRGRSWAATTSTAATAPDTLRASPVWRPCSDAGGGTSSYREVEETDLIVLWGSNARETHPIFFHHVLRAVNRGARLYAVDPRRTRPRSGRTAGSASTSGRDIALANAIGREIIAAGLEHRRVHRRAPRPASTTYNAKVEPYTLEYAERETGVPADAIRELAHAFATAQRAMICWTLGITEHHNARGQRPRADLARRC